jgi:hypothetical protein
MIRDSLLVSLVNKQTNLFQTNAPMAQRENVLMQIQERQKELRKMNKGDEVE